MAITKNDIRKDLRVVRNLIGKIPVHDEYHEFGKFSPHTALRLFGSWNKVLQDTFGKVNQEIIGCVSAECTWCGEKFQRATSQVSRVKHLFCSKSCAAKYNNTHKTKGNRRSKLEKWIEDKLKEKYPKIEILCNDKLTIGSELDFYIPSLRLAFEMNGIFHYEPIFGKDKLESIRKNDNNKFQLCLQNSIELCIIDTSALKYWKEDKAKKYLDIMVKIIDERLTQVEPQAVVACSPGSVHRA
jgi:hypothetical protein